MKLVIHEDYLSPLVNLAEVDYRDTRQGEVEGLATVDEWVRRHEDLAPRFLPLLKRCGVRLEGRLLDLAAGSGWLSAALSRESGVERVTTLDICRRYLEQVTPQVMSRLGCEESKIELVLGDFHRLLFEDGSFDTILVDAGLHHAVDLPVVLGECHRVLVGGGQLVALRELTTPPLRLRRVTRTRRRLLEQGVTENMYSLPEWRGFFERAGFALEHHLVCFRPPGLLRTLDELLIRATHPRYLYVGTRGS